MVFISTAPIVMDASFRSCLKIGWIVGGAVGPFAHWVVAPEAATNGVLRSAVDIKFILSPNLSLRKLIGA